MTTQRIRQVAILAVLILMTACASKPKIESDLGMEDAPQWVNEGTRFLSDDDGRLFHGVGSAQPMGDDSLQSSTADNRARAEIARILSSYMNVVMRDYAASGGTGDRVASDQDITRQIENISRINLTGAKVIARWRHPDSGAIYSLAELDMKHVQSTVSEVKRMNSTLGDFMSSEANNIFDRVSSEGAK